ncbi:MULTISPECIES: 2-hydroxyacid dehydrogenase [Hydrocarboniphaga]|jgi:D-lactate dehydrogenase|uniref:D-lactate dehydrogenase n=1 Tax=Hydrocarboniphaga effusa AP103 TaxID=1172194 RepID=I7ZGG0_9GAMM|nr:MULTISPECIES: 2-hydroxyacid dehydrogenase [Hydrocarboniphaga]EIT70964.1 D-lactate dehydrogenase [Hydrocarboniphaga effusa AP103]MDZ4079032.1 2-hydroxyacid dehydrogenase [Hydrocarboniphaga sp.]
MRVIVYSAHRHDIRDLSAANSAQAHAFEFFEARLGVDTARLAEGFDAVCTFVNDSLDAVVLGKLAKAGIRLVALRCAGYNQVDLDAAQRLGLCVLRVPAYSPHAVAEHAVGLVLTLNRHLHRAYNRTRENDFRLDGLEGFDLFGKTVGVIGVGRIGAVFARIMLGFGCRVLVHDAFTVPADLLQLGARQSPLAELLAQSDIVSLHCPLTPQTHHLIDASALSTMKPGVMLINTSRGGLLDTTAVIAALKEGRVGFLGLDVYEQEGDLFFEDLSSTIVADDVFQRLLTFPNVVVTGHQAFFTREALAAIATTTIANLDDFAAGRATTSPNRVDLGLVRRATR